jgi:CheY-like chemotaxis protein
MAIVLGNAELLLSGDVDESPEIFLEEIRKSAVRGGELTKRLLSFARKSNLVTELLNANQCVMEMSDLLRRTIPQNIEIKTTLMAGLWPCKTDKSFLDSALLNLVVNARDAMPEGGLLTIETTNVRINEEYIEDRDEDLEPGRYIMLAVTDTGIGIEPDLIPKIFDPFVTTKGPDAGTGLGLSMVQGFAKQSGGTVRIYSEKGVGTSVKIYLGAHDASEELLVSAPALPDTPKMSGRILLAEDEEGLRKIVRVFLETAGFEVSDAATGDQAFKIFLRDPDAFDLIVTDVIMPGKLQGPMMVREVREIRGDMPAVYVSGYPHEANVHGNGIRGDDISLTKPLQRTAFIGAVQKAISKATRMKKSQ